MLYPPTTYLYLLHEPPAVRPVYDIPPVIGSTGLRRLAFRTASRLRRHLR
jgi:hypothetical protein